MQVEMDLGWLLDPFLDDFGAMLGAKLALKSTSKASKTDVKTISKNESKKIDAEHRGALWNAVGHFETAPPLRI